MFKKTAPYSFTNYCKIQTADTLGIIVPIGDIISEFQVSSYDDVQFNNANTITVAKGKKFLVHVTQKVQISNPAGKVIGPDTNGDVNCFNNYPVLLSVNHSIDEAENPGLHFQLLQHTPKTINTQVQQSLSSGSNKGVTSSSGRASTVGSTTSETNSYGASVSLEGGSTNAEHSSTVTNEHSLTMNAENSRNLAKESSASEAMSLKDWGVYSWIDPANGSPMWRFGQEFPWNAITFNKSPHPAPPYSANPNQFPLCIPQEQLANLMDTYSDEGLMAYPPSQLSLFGVDFVTKALWLITIDTSNPAAVFNLAINQAISYFTASHVIIDGQMVVYMDVNPTIPKPLNSSFEVNLDLCLMALDPLSMLDKSAITGFVPNKFMIKPTPSTLFQMISPGNNLMVKDTSAYLTGEDFAFLSSDMGLNTNFALPHPLELTIFFKVVDITNDYMLFIKHWRIGAVGIALDFIFNGDDDHPLTKYVDAPEGEGGENNLLQINLRNQDYASINYHDYLQLGLNSIQIRMSPIGDLFSADSAYQLRALSIETV